MGRCDVWGGCPRLIVAIGRPAFPSVRPPIHLANRPHYDRQARRVCIPHGGGICRAARAPDSLTNQLHPHSRKVGLRSVPVAAPRLAPSAPRALAIASAPAPPRFSVSAGPIALGATAISSALARQRHSASAFSPAMLRRTRPRCLRLSAARQGGGRDQVLHQSHEAHGPGPDGPAAHRSRHADSHAPVAPPRVDPEPDRPDRHRDAGPHPALSLRAAHPPRPRRAQPSLPRTRLCPASPLADP